MIQATQLRPGMIIIYENDLFRVTAIHHLTPGNKRGFMQTKMKNLKTGIGTEKKFRSEDRLEQATLDTRPMQYQQLSLPAEEIGDLLKYLLSNQIVEIEFFDGKPVGINLPSTVDLEVVETEPSFKGATASASYKPAKLETGVTVQVPPFVQVGDKIRVDPSEGTYLERIK